MAKAEAAALRRGALTGIVALGCVLCGSAAAADATVLHYTARLHGVGLLEASFCLQLDAARYATHLSARTVGLLDVLVHGRSESASSGALDAGGQVRPTDYVDRSRLSGEDYLMAIGYPDGHAVVRAQSPPQDKYRSVIAPALLAESVDGLSAVLVQSLAASRRGACASTVVYDGRQVRRLAMHEAGRERLGARSGSAFAGEALRCETVSTMLGGFLKAASIAEQSKSRHGTLWLAAVQAGGPAVPVRMVFDADFWGEIVVEMDGVTRAEACGR